MDRRGESFDMRFHSSHEVVFLSQLSGSSHFTGTKIMYDDVKRKGRKDP